MRCSFHANNDIDDTTSCDETEVRKITKTHATVSKLLAVKIINFYCIFTVSIKHGFNFRLLNTKEDRETET